MMPSIVPLTDAQQRLVRENTPLIFYVARRYLHIPAEDFQELTGQLYYRLCLAVQNWDPSLGYKISSYLVKSLDGETKNFFRDQIWLVKPPRALREQSLSRMLDTVGDSMSDAALAGEDAERIRTCVLPRCLELLDVTDSDDLVDEGFLAPDDVEGEVVGRLGGRQLLREVYQALKPEERVILALISAEHRRPDPGTRRRLKSVTVEIQRRFLVGRATAEQAQTELQEKLRRLYARAEEGERLPQSTGSRALNRALLPRFQPHVAGFLSRRGCPSELPLAERQPA